MKAEEMIVRIGSGNRVKILAARNAFKRAFEPNGIKVLVSGVEVSSGVGCQPISLDSIIEGAFNRARNAFYTECDYGVGIESGIHYKNNRYFDTSYCIIFGKDKIVGIGNSGSFEVPEKMMEEINKGKELGHIIEEFTNGYYTKHTGGVAGYLSKDLIGRKRFIEQAVEFALFPLISPEEY